MRSLKAIAVAVCLASTVFPAPPIPRLAPDFTVVDSSGKPHSLASCRGKVVLVQFLYTTCSHCQATARMYSRLAAELAPRGLAISFCKTSAPAFETLPSSRLTIAPM
jgi:cytochrome oxidase Cu insertion factor (SCO1/SenC/PrrC family)